jgi:hypothetical protein
MWQPIDTCPTERPRITGAAPMSQTIRTDQTAASGASVVMPL